MFIVRIRTRGDAFSNNQGSLRSNEVAGCLHGIAEGLKADEPIDGSVETFNHDVWDADGNVCGTIHYTAHDLDDDDEMFVAFHDNE
jgi:hypothetical protein